MRKNYSKVNITNGICIMRTQQYHLGRVAKWCNSAMNCWRDLWMPTPMSHHALRSSMKFL